MIVTASYQRDSKRLRLNLPDKWDTDQIKANAITATEINVSQLSAIATDMGSLTAGTVTGGTIQTAASGARVVMDTGGIKVYDASNQRGELNNDGSGWFGNNSNFAWNTGGTLTINATLVDSVAASIIGGWRYQATNYMDGGDIQANSVTATQISVTNLAAINADMGTITAGSISAARITSGSLHTDRIAAGTITGTQMNVANLAAISADLGTITAGSMNAARITAGSLSVARTDADVTADNAQNLGWITGTAGTLTIASSGKLAINVADALEIQAAGNIKVLAGGDIILIGHDTNSADLIWDGTKDISFAMSADGQYFGIWPETANEAFFGIGWKQDSATGSEQRFDLINLKAERGTAISGKTAAAKECTITAFSDGDRGEGIVKVQEGASTYEYHFRVAALYPDTSNVIDLGTSSLKWKQGWFNDYVIAEGGVHVGGTSDPSTDNLIVDGTSLLTGNVTASGWMKVTDYIVATGGLKVGSDADPGTDNLIVDGQSAFGTTIAATIQLEVLAPDAQSDIFIGARGYTLSDALNNYGVMGEATGGSATNNFGVYGNAASASNVNYHYYSGSGAFCTNDWFPPSKREYKSDILEFEELDIDGLYGELDAVKPVKFRYKKVIRSEMNKETGEILTEREENPSAPHIYGFIADDPNVSDFLRDDDRLSWSPSSASAYALLCIKHLKKLNADLIQRVELLEAA